MLVELLFELLLLWCALIEIKGLTRHPVLHQRVCGPGHGKGQCPDHVYSYVGMRGVRDCPCDVHAMSMCYSSLNHYHPIGARCQCHVYCINYPMLSAGT